MFRLTYVLLFGRKGGGKRVFTKIMTKLRREFILLYIYLTLFSGVKDLKCE